MGVWGGPSVLLEPKEVPQACFLEVFKEFEGPGKSTLVGEFVHFVNTLPPSCAQELCHAQTWGSDPRSIPFPASLHQPHLLPAVLMNWMLCGGVYCVLCVYCVNCIVCVSDYLSV